MSELTPHDKPIKINLDQLASQLAARAVAESWAAEAESGEGDYDLASADAVLASEWWCYGVAHDHLAHPLSYDDKPEPQRVYRWVIVHAVLQAAGYSFAFEHMNRGVDVIDDPHWKLFTSIVFERTTAALCTLQDSARQSFGGGLTYARRCAGHRLRPCKRP